MKAKKRNHIHKAFLSDSSNSPLEQIMKSAGFGLLITIAISLALLFSGTAIALTTSDPTILIKPIGYVTLFVSAFLGGFACSKINTRSPYLTAMICGIGFVIVSMLFSFAIPHSLASGMDIMSRLLIHLSSIVSFVIGSFVSIKANKPNKKSRRKR